MDHPEEDVSGLIVFFFEIVLSHFGKGGIPGLVSLYDIPGPLVYHQQVVVLVKDLQVFWGAVLRGIHLDVWFKVERKR